MNGREGPNSVCVSGGVRARGLRYRLSEGHGSSIREGINCGVRLPAKGKSAAVDMVLTLTCEVVVTLTRMT